MDLKERIEKLTDNLSFMLDIIVSVGFVWYTILLIKRLFEPKNLLSALTTGVSIVVWVVFFAYCLTRIVMLLREARKIKTAYKRWLKKKTYEREESAKFNDMIDDLKFIWVFNPLAWPARHEIKNLYMSRRRLESNNEEE